MAAPTITRAAFRAIFNRKIGDKPISVTTTTAGADTTFDTAIATALIEHKSFTGSGNTLVGKWCFVPGAITSGTSTTGEERKIVSFDPVTGTLGFDRGFTARVATATPIEIHANPVGDKHDIFTDTLRWVSIKGHFFNPSYDETLWGQEEYGAEGSEFNKRLYAVPTAFVRFPDRIWVQDAYTGTHTGSDDASALTDSGAAWVTSELVGLTIYNKTDGSSGTVTANTSTTVTATLSGGTGSDWDAADEYIIAKPDAIPILLTDLPGNDFRITKAAHEGAFQFYAVIPETYLIKLEGNGALTEFTTEASTTELSNQEADIVCIKAAALWKEFQAASSSPKDADKLYEQANRFHGLYEESRGEAQKPVQRPGISIRFPQ